MIPVLSDVEIYGNLNINKNTTLKGTLEVGSTTTLKDTLEVGSTTILKGTLEVGSTTTLKGTLDVSSNTILTRNLEAGNSISCTALTIKNHINTNIYFNNDKTIDIKNNLKIGYIIVERTVDSNHFDFSVDYPGTMHNAFFWNNETGKRIGVIESTRNNTLYGTIIDYITKTPYTMKGIITYIEPESNTHTIVDIKDCLYLGNLNKTKYYGNNEDDVNLMKTLGGEYIVWLIPNASASDDAMEVGKINLDITNKSSYAYGSTFIVSGILGQIYFMNLTWSDKFNTKISSRMYLLDDTGFDDLADIWTIDNLYFTRSMIQQY